jgi:hypothetical protein
MWNTLQRHNTENLKQKVPEKELRGLSPISCVCDRSWKYTNRLQTHECGNWDWGRAIPFLGIHKWDFRCSALPVEGKYWIRPNASLLSSFLAKRPFPLTTNSQNGHHPTLWMELKKTTEKGMHLTHVSTMATMNFKIKLENWPQTWAQCRAKLCKNKICVLFVNRLENVSKSLTSQCRIVCGMSMFILSRDEKMTSSYCRSRYTTVVGVQWRCHAEMILADFLQDSRLADFLSIMFLEDFLQNLGPHFI